MNIRRMLYLLMLISSPAAAQVLFEQIDSSRTPRTVDILHYALDLRFDESRKTVEGVSRITFTPLTGPADSIILDGVAMTIRSVTGPGGNSLVHLTDGRYVTVYLSPSLGAADTATIAISYSCAPARGLHFIQPDSSDMTRRWQIWTQGEESDNRYWFPCYDAPDDKATSEVRATATSGYTLVSNGELLTMDEDSLNGTRTFHWRQRLPHSSYLIMIAAGNYAIVRDEEGRFPIYHYVYPEDSAYSHVIYGGTRNIIEHLEKLTGFPYPWEKYSHIILDEFMWGGMENTSAVTLNDVYLYDSRAALDFSADAVIAHEVAHQWWGDVVTCADWTHLWLNEGFANYYESLVKRSDEGRDADLFEAAQWIRAIKAVEVRSGRKPVVSEESYTVNLYSKGAWTLRMLARILGENELLEALSHYLRTHAFEPVTTEDLVTSLEESTGEDLRWFFDQWIYGAGMPELGISADWSQSRGVLRITIEQEQKTDTLTGLFDFPVDIEITTSSGRNIHSIRVREQEETFSFPLDERPLMVIFDKGRTVLADRTFPKSVSELLYQLRSASDAVDRYDAAEGLSGSVDEERVFAALARSAREDRSREVRQRCVELLATSEVEAVPSVLMEIYVDPDSRVRNAAIRGLERFRTEEVATFVQQAALTDSSYYVLSSCIKTLAALDPTRGFALAARYVGLDSHRDIVRRSALTAFETIGDPASIPHLLPITGPTYERAARRTAVSVLGEVGKGNNEARDVLMKIASGPLPDLRNSAIRALGKWDDPMARSFLKERADIESDPDVIGAIRRALSDESSP